MERSAAGWVRGDVAELAKVARGLKGTVVFEVEALSEEGLGAEPKL